MMIIIELQEKKDYIAASTSFISEYVLTVTEVAFNISMKLNC